MSKDPRASHLLTFTSLYVTYVASSCKRAMSISRPQPESIERALQTMRARYREMSGSQRRLADYMLEKPYQIAFASAAKVGGDLGISSATVVRFAEFLGLSGYADLQELARKGVAREASEVV